eukprot:g25.t1
MAVRTEVITRALDLLSDILFFSDTVFPAESEENGMAFWKWSWQGQFVTAIFV